jgi:hypothetical protein
VLLTRGTQNGFPQLQQKRSVKPPKKAEVYQCLNQAYWCGSRLALLLLLMNICIAVSLNAHADSDTHWQQGAVSLTVDPRCNVSILPISNTGTVARGTDMKATCVRSAYASPGGPGSVATSNVKGSAGAGPQIVGYVLPVTIASHTGPLASLSVTNPSDRVIHLKADVKEWHQDSFGQDVFVASSTAFISPTRVLIEPGVIRRLTVKLPKAGEQELAFRIVLAAVAGRNPHQRLRYLLENNAIDASFLRTGATTEIEATRSPHRGPIPADHE